MPAENTETTYLVVEHAEREHPRYKAAETLQGLTGGYMNYSPPKLTTGIMNRVVIEAGSTGLDFEN